jgi:NitT/TauT family transport system substrate-binding protein
MDKFRILSHGRLQEWVAEENGYFKDEGLDYEFKMMPAAGWSAHVQSTESAPVTVLRGAFESYENGRGCNVSSACHWAVNMASSAGHGRMWGHAYAVAPSGIYVPPDSPIKQPTDLANVEVTVGYHSGSHFSALQALESFIGPNQIKLSFRGLPLDRLALLWERRVAAANLYGAPTYVLEQQGFRKVLDTTFMIGFLVTSDSSEEELERYFRALRRAQRDIDIEPERYKHYFLKELPERYHAMIDVRTFGPGERMVFEPYTQEMFERTHKWMEGWKIFPEEQAGSLGYKDSVLTGSS